MLCLPALTPVANDAHAVGDSGECVVPSECTPPPCFASFCMFGRRPSSMYRWTSLRIHAVESEDDELLLKRFRRAITDARPCADTNEQQECEESLHSVAGREIITSR